MKPLQATFFILAVFFSGTGFAQQSALPAADQRGASSEAAAQEETPAQQRIAAAKQQIEKDPKKVQAWNELAIAFLRRARESADSRYLQDADGALAQGLKLDSEDFQLQKTQAALLLSRHELVKARDRAILLNRRTPDDVMPYAYIAEADVALGDYADAEKNAQWAMNLRPYNTPALLVGAKLRALYGDTHGAIAFLNRAYAQTSPIELEEQAWIANQIAALEIESGQGDAAERTLERAEDLFPHYPHTLENLARVRMGRHRPGDAAALLAQATQIDSDPHVLYTLATAQAAAGLPAQARATYADFERLASDPATQSDDAIRDLILMYARSAASAGKALALAQQQIDVRHDVFTLDAYAWALFANGKFEEANAAEQKAIAVGIQSAQIFDHAGHIAQTLNRPEDAARYFELAIRSNPVSEYAQDARAASGLPEDSATQQVTSALPPDATSVPVTSPREGSADASHRPSQQPNRDPATASPAKAASEASFSAVPPELLTPRRTETDRTIRTAQATAARDPKSAQAYAALGAAFFQRARETGDVSDYQSAEQALTKSLDLASADFAADAPLAAMSEVCMGEHRFSDALTYAHKALSLDSGDVSPFAIVGDAYADMGEYDKARAAYVRLTPGDKPLSPRAAYSRDSRISYLSFISGDTIEAIRLMKIAVAEGAEAQIPSENLAWLYYELGEYSVQAGDSSAANAAFLAALTIHPGDYRALASLAKLRANHGRYAEAIELYRKAIAVVPMPIFVAELGDLYAQSGDMADANLQYQLVEYIGKLGRINQVLHNRDLALFYADHNTNLTEALELAQKEFEVRHDIYTWDALAWALYKNGKLADAARASEQAMQFGTRDALLLFHAGMIAERMGRQEQARAKLKQALQINSHFHLLYADQAQQALGLLDARSASNESAVSHAR